jgi:hypothetical protein
VPEVLPEAPMVAAAGGEEEVHEEIHGEVHAPMV